LHCCARRTVGAMTETTIALVTGANKGIGHMVVRRLAERGHQTVEEGSDAIVRLATLGPDGPTGGFFDRTGPVPW
jgi:hypothetical protein